MVRKRISIGTGTRLVIALIFLLLQLPMVASAHPGRTASDGCHYCRTNCDSWGEAWDERHCHGGGSAPAPAPVPEPEPEPETESLTATVSVTEVIDGDTIRVRFGSGAIEKVRLIGIDTPETVDPRTSVECFGKEASARLNELVEGKTITLTHDGVGDTIDTYDRLLRYVALGSTDINAKMIQDGYAYAYVSYPFGKMTEYRQLEVEAKAAERGLWAPGVCAVPEEPSTAAASAAAPPPAMPPPIRPPTTPVVTEAPATAEDSSGTGTVAGATIASGLGYGLWKLLKMKGSKP